MDKKLSEIETGLSLLSVFRSTLDTPLIDCLHRLFFVLDKKPAEAVIDQAAPIYGKLCSEIYKAGGDLALAVQDIVLKEDNPYLEMVIKEADTCFSCLYRQERTCPL